MNFVVGRKGPGAHYIGRGSPLGNPFVIGKDGGREAVCEKYQSWFEDQVRNRNPAVLQELYNIQTEAQSHGWVKLGCFCAPQRCHGETIKAFLESNHVRLTRPPGSRQLAIEVTPRG